MTQKTSFSSKIGKVIILFIFLAEGIITYKFFLANPCDKTKTFSIDRIDSKFGISTSTVLAYSKEGAAIWNKSYKANPLLTYKDTGGDIIISFIYDERQRTTIRNAKLRWEINKEKADLNGVSETITPLQSEYYSLQTTILNDTNAYEAHLAKYNQQVQYWNKRGGTPPSEYQALQNDKNQLDLERASLNTEIARINELASTIRNFGASHNQEIDILNDKIRDLNSTAKRDFEEGLYDPNNKTITIYEYDSPIALKRVLTHELGHAIGMEHVENMDSIMYPVNEGQNLLPTKQDLTELFKVCKQKSIRDYFQK